MKQSRTLSLKRESLAELGTDELSYVNGAADAVTTMCPIPTRDYGLCSIRCQMTFNTCG